MLLPLSVADLAVVVARLRAAGCVFAEEEAAVLREAATDRTQLEHLLGQREQGRPLEQVVGWVDFCGVRVAVAAGVFVPRRRTELLAREAVALAPPEPVVVDLCCGSGAIALVLARRLTAATVHAADLDEASVACARGNLRGLGTVWQGDLFAALPVDLRGRVDVLAVNAPYVPTAAIALMPREARTYEPRGALDGGPDGLALHRRVAAEASAWLAPAGHLLLECSAAQAPLTARRAGVGRTGCSDRPRRRPGRDRGRRRQRSRYARRMPQSVAELLDLLDLEEIETGLFRARQPETQLQRVFGGEVLAQALMAAARTVPVTRVLHSLHGYFLLPGRTDIPIVYDVEAVRDGGSFSSRRVVARQGGRVIFYLSSSFHEVEEGFEHVDPIPGDVPPPEDCPRLAEVMARASGRSASFWEREWGVLDVRYVGDSRPGGTLFSPEHPARARVWVRVTAPLPDDRRIHQAALAYASDLTLLSAGTVPHNVLIGLQVQASSIDHAMWFHRPFRADEWLLYDQISPSASAGLALATARLFQSGTLVSNVAQEGLLRKLR